MQVRPGTPGFETFVAKIREMSDVDVELPWTPIRVSELGAATIAPADLRVLFGTFLVDSEMSPSE